MVQAIVRQSGGHIIVDSQPNAGTTFRVYFPRRTWRSRRRLPSAPATTIVRGEGTVLLAEDDRSVRRLVVSELTRRGFTVLEAEDGAAALDLFRKESGRVDVLVTDVVMPRMNGADLARAAEGIPSGPQDPLHFRPSGALRRRTRSDRRHQPAHESRSPPTRWRRASRSSSPGGKRPMAGSPEAPALSDSTTQSPRRGDPGLRRALGKWDLTAIGVNQVIGSAIFLLPSDVAKQIGPWGPLAFMAIGLLSLSIALCFAEVGSRFETTGGPYLPARAAFGRFVGFETGWMMWFARVTSHASVVNGLTLALAFYWPALAIGAPRAATITALTAFLTWINVRGIKQASWFVNALTIGKLLPLAIFIIGGVWFIDPAHFTNMPDVARNRSRPRRFC
jgi:hypothetical protein